MSTSAESRRTAMEDTQHEREPDTNATRITANPLSSHVVESESDVAESGAARALEELRWAYTENRADFRQVAALEEPDVEVRDAVRVLLGLSPEVLGALGVVKRLPKADLEVVAATLALPSDVQATLRAILS
jgi:hypothetical protein